MSILDTSNTLDRLNFHQISIKNDMLIDMTGQTKSSNEKPKNTMISQNKTFMLPDNSNRCGLISNY